MISHPYKQFTFHDLRHTHATLLLQAGVNIKVIQERLDHESVTLILATYSYLFYWLLGLP